MSFLDRPSGHTDAAHAKVSATDRFLNQLATAAGFLGALVFGPFIFVRVDQLTYGFMEMWGTGFFATLADLAMKVTVGVIIFLALRQLVYLVLLALIAVLSWVATGGGFFSRSATAVY